MVLLQGNVAKLDDDMGRGRRQTHFIFGVVQHLTRGDVDITGKLWLWSGVSGLVGISKVVLVLKIPVCHEANRC